MRSPVVAEGTVGSIEPVLAVEDWPGMAIVAEPAMRMLRKTGLPSPQQVCCTVVRRNRG